MGGRIPGLFASIVLILYSLVSSPIFGARPKSVAKPVVVTCAPAAARLARGEMEWDRPTVLKYLRIVADSKEPKIAMNSTSFGKQNSKVIQALTGYSGSYLMELAKEHVAPDWDGVLEALGLDVLSTRKAIKLAPELFTKALVALHDAGVEVNAAKLQDDQSERSREIIKEAIGSSITGAQVYWAGFSQHGRDWTKALTFAKLDPELVEKRHQWTKPQMIEILKKLDDAGVDLNVNSAFQPAFAWQLWRLTGIKANGEALYRVACNRFGSWDDFLIAAGKNPELIRRRQVWTKEKLVDVIKKLSKKGVALNVLAIMEPEFADSVYEIAGVRASGPSLYSAARSRFGSWDNLLRAADLNPADIRLNFWRIATLSAIPNQVEGWKNHDTGRYVVKRFAGRSAPRPDGAAARNELMDGLHAFVGELPAQDRPLALRVLDEVLGAAEVQDATTLSKALGEPVSDVKRVLGELAGCEFILKP